MATEQTWRTILRTNNADLLVLIDTENDLEGAVKQLGLGTNLQRKNIWGVKDNTIERNKRLLEFLRRGDFKQFKIFCEALVISGQESIVTDHLSEIKETWSSCSTDGSSDPRSYIPLRESYRDCLRQNWNYLLERIDNLSEIEAHLKSRESLTTFQQIKLQDFREDVDKVCFLLRLLENGSQKLFDDFCEILKSTKKQDLVVTLTPSDAQRALDDVKKTFIEVKLQSASDGERQRKLREIELKDAYPVSNGVVKGRVLIFSNRYFEISTLKPRNGTEYDEANLGDFFRKKCKFKTDIIRSFSSEQIRKTLTDEAKKDNNMRDFDIFIVFVMSHGRNGEIYGCDGTTLRTSEIVNLLCCPQLAGKPKLIFIQACRDGIEIQARQEVAGAKCPGPRELLGVYGIEVPAQEDGITPAVIELNNLTMNDGGPEVKTNPTSNEAVPEVIANPTSNDAVPEVIANPEEMATESALDALTYHPKADMAIFYATVSGDPSYRREDEGSFFVRLLLDVFTRKAHTEDVLTMVTEALRRVHELQIDESKQRQLGEQQSSLLRKVYLMI